MFLAKCAILVIISILWFGCLAVPIPEGIDVKSFLPQPETVRETAKLETEGFGSSVLQVYDGHQQKTLDFIENPRPLIDTISEQEKYGNDGDHFYGIGRAIVNGYENFANFMNKLLSGPSAVAGNLSAEITKQLNHIGGKLVGLA